MLIYRYTVKVSIYVYTLQMETKSRYRTKKGVVVQLIGEMGYNVKQDDQSKYVVVELDGEKLTMLRILFEALFNPAP